MKNIIKSILLVWCCCLTSCRQKPITIVYVVPTGFRGAFSVCQDQSGIENVQWSGNVAVITVASNGSAHTHSALPSQKWHDAKARYSDGTDLPVALSSTGDNTVALRRIPPRANEFNKEWLVVGGREDLRRALEKLDGFKWPP
jgi:hypothetical protein